MLRQIKLNFLPFLSMLYILSIITAFLFIPKETEITHLGIVSTGAFILPIAFVILNIIAEVYGYNIAKQTIWFGILSQIFFCIMTQVLLNISTVSTGVEYLSNGLYDKIFGDLPKVVFATSIAMLIALFLNTFLVCKWKIMLKGRYFWLRSLGASVIGEGILTLIGVLIICIGRDAPSLIWQFFLLSYLAKIVSTIIFCYPAAVFAAILKNINKDFIDSKAVKFNPFTLSNK